MNNCGRNDCDGELKTVESLLDAAAQYFTPLQTQCFTEACLQRYGNGWRNMLVCRCRYQDLITEAGKLLKQTISGKKG